MENIWDRKIMVEKPASNYWKIQDGYLCQESNGVRIYQDNGKAILLIGVKFRTSWVKQGTGYQINGTIHIAEPKNWTTMQIMHEYGHYLQQQNMGIYKYIKDVAIPSVYSLVTNPANHHNQSYEQDATTKGNNYYNQHVL